MDKERGSAIYKGDTLKALENKQTKTHKEKNPTLVLIVAPNED